MVSGEARESRRASKFSSFSTCAPYFRLPLLAGLLAHLVPLQADAQVQRDLRDVLLGKHDLALVLAQDLDPEREPLQLLHQHPEALRDAGLERVVALDDRLVGLDTADDVVRF